METLKPLIEQLEELIKGSKEFAIAQAPDFIRQYIICAVIEEIGWIIWGCALGVGVLFLAKWLYRKWDDVDELINFFGSLFLLISGIVSIWLIISNFDELMKIWLAPKAYLVVHLITLVK